MGSNTFMATGTNTIILFLKKRKELDYLICEDLVVNFLKTFKDFAYNEIPNVIQKYVEEYFEDLSVSDYINLLKNDINDVIKNNDIYINMCNSYKKTFKERNNSFVNTEKFREYINDCEKKK